MFKGIDTDNKEVIEGFCWDDKKGYVEYLVLDADDDTFSLKNSCDCFTTFYKSDIGKLIKALQAAEQHFKENK